MVTMLIHQSSRNGKQASNNNILNITLHMLMPPLNQLKLRYRRRPHDLPLHSNSLLLYICDVWAVKKEAFT